MFLLTFHTRADNAPTDNSSSFFTHGSTEMTEFQQMSFYFAGECRHLLLTADFMFGNRRLIKHHWNYKSPQLRSVRAAKSTKPNCVGINFSHPTYGSHDNEFKGQDVYVYKGTQVRNMNLSIVFL